jgi:hypothetical protein
MNQWHGFTKCTSTNITGLNATAIQSRRAINGNGTSGLYTFVPSPPNPPLPGLRGRRMILWEDRQCGVNGLQAYYNEIDPMQRSGSATSSAAGLIAPGDVDERSIADIVPDDLRGYTQCHFFAGIGVWSHALQARWMARRSSRLDRLLSLPAFLRGRRRRWV